MPYFGFLEVIPREHRRVDLGKDTETVYLEQLLVKEAAKIKYTLASKGQYTNCHSLGEKVFLFERFFFPEIMVAIEDNPSSSYVHICNRKSISLAGFKEKIEEYKNRIVAGVNNDSPQTFK